MEFSEHLNSLDPNIKFTSEIEKDGITFLGHLRPSREDSKTVPDPEFEIMGGGGGGRGHPDP